MSVFSRRPLIVYKAPDGTLEPFDNRKLESLNAAASAQSTVGSTAAAATSATSDVAAAKPSTDADSPTPAPRGTQMPVDDSAKPLMYPPSSELSDEDRERIYLEERAKHEEQSAAPDILREPELGDRRNIDCTREVTRRKELSFLKTFGYVVLTLLVLWAAFVLFTGVYIGPSSHGGIVIGNPYCENHPNECLKEMLRKQGRYADAERIPADHDASAFDETERGQEKERYQSAHPDIR